MSTEEQVTPENQNQFLSSGIDSLYATYALDMACGAIDFGELEYLKTRIRDDPTRQSERITLGGLDLHLLPIGQHPYRYALENREFVIRLAERMQPSCAVQFKSEALWAKGYRALNQQIEDWARALGLVQTRPCGVSRLDFAFDYHLPHRNFTLDNFRSRAKKDVVWRNAGKVETFSFGTGDVVVRIYDKSAEIAQSSQKTWFYSIWGRSDDVWRIEFQVRRERLVRGGVNSIADIEDCLGDLLRELASNHTTLRSNCTDANRSRWPLHPLWRNLQQQIVQIAQMGLGAGRRGRDCP